MNTNEPTRLTMTFSQEELEVLRDCLHRRQGILLAKWNKLLTVGKDFSKAQVQEINGVTDMVERIHDTEMGWVDENGTPKDEVK